MPLISFELEDGSQILVESQTSAVGGLAPASRAEDAVEAASQTFEQALDRVRPAASTIIAKLKSLSEPADEVTVEFGLNLQAKAGAVIASASVDAHYKVSLKWKRDVKADPSAQPSAQGRAGGG